MSGVFQRGRVVRSLAGRDKGYLLSVTEAEGSRVYVCDGKERPIDRPKVKNSRHLEPTEIFLSEDDMASDRALRRALKKAGAELSNV